MSKIKTYRNVSDWVAAEYSVSNLKKKNYDLQSLTFAGQIAKTVHPFSPAGHLGIQANDILFEVNGGTFDEDDLAKTFTGRKFGRSHSFKFFRPSTNEAYTIKGTQFPYGLSLKNSPEAFSALLQNGDPAPYDTCEFWESGDRAALAKLWPSLEVFSIRMRDLNGAPYGAPLPQSIATESPLPSPNICWPGHFAWLALCAAYAGEIDRAAFVLAQVDAHFDRSGDNAMLNTFAAMEHTHAMISEARYNPDFAINRIKRAINHAPDNKELYKYLSDLTGTHHSPPASRFLNMKPHYDLPRHDPLGLFQQDQGQISLENRVKALSSGQFILLTIMSNYRTNGPYVSGFKRALTPLSRLDCFKDVHIVTSSTPEDYSQKLTLPIMESQLEKAEIDVSLLYDTDDSLSEQLSTSSAPTNLIIDHHGVIIAEGWLEGDQVLWDALSTISK